MRSGDDSEAGCDPAARFLGRSRAACRLLVSVRNVAEAEAALAGGVDLVDVKEPANGPLGMADPATIATIVDCVRANDPAGRIVTTATLGELREWDDSRRSIVLRRVPDLLKVGLAGEASRPDWAERWSRLRERVGRSAAARWIGVVYADAAAAAPPPAAVIDHALASGAAGLLFDTFDKSAGGLRSHLGDAQLGRFVERVRRAGGLVALAGRIAIDDLPFLASLHPDVIAVRSAVCVNGDRDEAIDPERVRSFAGAVHAATFAPV